MRHVDLLNPARLDDRELAEWQRLADRSIEPNPFYEPSFVLAALEAGETSAKGLKLLVVSSADDGRWLACLPVVKSRFRRLLPVWQAWNGPYVFLTSPLLAGESPGQILAEMIRKAPRRVTGRAFELATVPDEDLFGMALHSGLLELDRTPDLVRGFERAKLTRRDDPATYRESISAHHRRESNRKRRRLADVAGAPLETVPTGATQEAIDTFLALEDSGWKGDAGTALASRETDARFFRLMCEKFRKLGRVDVIFLRTDDHVFAGECVLVAGEVCFTFKIAFDETYARLSPGFTMMLAQVDWFHETGLAWMDSCADPDNHTINRLWPERRKLRSMIFIEPGWRNTPARILLKLAKSLKRKGLKR